MAQLTIVYWRDIPAQVTVKEGRRTVRVPLSARFEKAIDRAAMKAKMRDSDSYLAEWRRSAPSDVEGDPQEIAARISADIENNFNEERLAQLISSGGLESR